jgi:hypothetical protein
MDEATIKNEEEHGEQQEEVVVVAMVMAAGRERHRATVPQSPTSGTVPGRQWSGYISSTFSFSFFSFFSSPPLS